MAGTLKPVRFKLAWQGFRVGDIITPNGTTRDFLVGNGYADIVEEAETPARPGKLAAKAAKKIAEASKSMFGE